MGYLKAGDVISGQMGVAFLTINGKNEEMFYLKDLEAVVEKEKTAIRVMGKKGDQQKTTGASGTGSMTIYAVTSIFAKMAEDLLKHGKDTYFQIKTTNDDPDSTIGRQSILLKNVNLDSLPVVNLDVDAEALEQSMDFTYDDLDLLEQFKKPVLG